MNTKKQYFHEWDGHKLKYHLMFMHEMKFDLTTKHQIKFSVSFTLQNCNDAAVAIMTKIIWASSRENLSSGFATRVDSNRSAQPQKLDRGLKF